METQHWNLEYQFRKLFPMTHDQFMDTPLNEIDWLLRIHGVHVQAENKRNSQK